MYVISLSLIVMILGIIVYSENIKPIGIIENVKRALREITQKSNTVEQSDVTTVDVTGIELGKETQHEHVYKTMYDENKHWEECSVCGTKRSETTHRITTSWALGYESCEVNNYQNRTCSCGYLTIYHKPCVWDGKSYHIGSTNWHRKLCNVCKKVIFDEYYLGTYGKGNIYKGSNELCTLSNGKLANCLNHGKCQKCGGVRNNANHVIYGDSLTGMGKIACTICEKEFGTYYQSISKDNNIPALYTITTNVNLTNGAVFRNIYGAEELKNTWGISDGSALFQTNKQVVTNKNSTGTQFTLITTARLKNNIRNIKYDQIRMWINVNGVKNQIFFPLESIPESVKPVISNISIGDKNVWKSSKAITISGTENWTNTVTIKIENNQGGVVYEGTADVTSNNWSVTCIPELETGSEVKTFKAIVTDECENSIEKEFTISKIDAIPPEVTSEDKVSDGWAREKNFIFTASDYGIGNVQIGFNDVNDYSLAVKNGTEYSREYKLVGDVYSPREANVYYKDELGNVSTKKVILDKLDNTEPTITGASFSNNKLNVIAHDRHQVEGEGSGVAKYRFITSTTKLESPEVTTENSTELNVGEDMIIPDIYKVKYVYVVAEDAVGNISNVYEVEVPQLELTSKVNLSGNNGKGVVELDWSSYDSSNKYFVVYRKEKDSTDWKKIVGIENKLTGNKYTDNLGNDKEVPTVPSINIAGNSERNSIDITVDAQDNWSNYMYYVESYDSTTNTLLSRSDS